ncbi:hypothetical protein MTR64_16840, partial [Novosphingobium sp. 2580]|nr:hypothetical protein [Novosphingobium album (ex Hu et al. 2023)]
TDDKPFLHRRGRYYYLSWGSYYAIGESPYGPFECKGPLFFAENADPEFLDDSAVVQLEAAYRPRDWLNFDRHGSFFEFRGQWYFACNDQSQPGSGPFFRNSVICHVHYRDNGEIMPLRLTRVGVGQDHARRGIAACDFFEADLARVEECGDALCVRFQAGGYACYPNTRCLAAAATAVAILPGEHGSSGTLEIRRARPDGPLLGSIALSDRGIAPDGYRTRLSSVRENEDLCLVLQGADGVEAAIEKIVFF